MTGNSALQNRIDARQQHSRAALWTFESLQKTLPGLCKQFVSKKASLRQTHTFSHVEYISKKYSNWRRNRPVASNRIRVGKSYQRELPNTHALLSIHRPINNFRLIEGTATIMPFGYVYSVHCTTRKLSPLGRCVHCANIFPNHIITDTAQSQSTNKNGNGVRNMVWFDGGVFESSN